MQRSGDVIVEFGGDNERIQQGHVRWQTVAHGPGVPSSYRRQQRIRRRHRNHQTGLTVCRHSSTNCAN
jgi:hypothetical protein